MVDEEEDLAELYHQSGNVRDEEPSGTTGLGHNSQQEVDEVIRLLENGDLGKRALRSMLENLVQAVENGTASHQDYANLIRLLKEMGMTMGDPYATPSSQRSGPADLPQYGKPDYEE